MSIILIAGGTGLVGTRLAEICRKRGDTVRLLTRKPKGEGEFAWNPQEKTMDESALEGVDYLINLAGAGIADRRWTAARKRELIESRTSSNATLAAAISRSKQPPKAFVCASAIGYYGNSGERAMQETDAPVDRSFMVDCCEQWESSAQLIAAQSIRTTLLRIGVVLAKEGGALAEIAKPIRFGLGAYFADGRAWYSWIHRDDLCHIFLYAIDNQSINGIFNAVAPQPVRNKPLTQAIAKAMGRWAIFAPAPAFIMRLILGEMSAVVLNSNLISAKKLQGAGFSFQYPNVESALREIYSNE
jgi:uncharacterized protein